MNPPIAQLTRRAFVALCGAPAVAAVPAAPSSGGAASDAAPSTPFADLCARLTGFPAAALPPGFAAALHGALLSAGRGDALDAALQGASDAALECDIIAACYSGVLPGVDGPVVASFYGALVWEAASFAVPRGACAGAGSWSKRPPAVAGTS